MLIFLLYTGLRRGEIIPLTWKDIDLKNKVIHINKAIYFDGNTPKLKDTKTDAGNRDIIILDCLYEKIKTWKRTGIYVFNNNGNMYTESVFSKRWNNYRNEIKLPHLTPHVLRHTFCTMLYEADIHVKDAQKIMGHADINTTQNRYTHVRDSRVKFSLDKLNNKINKKTELSSGCQITSIP